MVDGELHYTKMWRFRMIIRRNIRMVTTWKRDYCSSNHVNQIISLTTSYNRTCTHTHTLMLCNDIISNYICFHKTATFVLLLQTLPSKPTCSVTARNIIHKKTTTTSLRRVPYCRRCGDRWMPLKRNGRRSYSVAMMSTGSICLPGHGKCQFPTAKKPSVSANWWQKWFGNLYSDPEKI